MSCGARETHVKELEQSASSNTGERGERTRRISNVRHKMVKCTGLNPPGASSLAGGIILAVLV